MKVLVLVAGFIMAISASAEVYRWTDENGKVHFSDKPRHGGATEKVEVKVPQNSYGGSDVLERQRDLLDRYDQEARQEAKQQRKDAIEEQRQERQQASCNSYRDYWKRIQRGGPMYKLNGNGERVYYSEEERAKRIEFHRKRMEKVCSG